MRITSCWGGTGDGSSSYYCLGCQAGHNSPCCVGIRSEAQAVRVWDCIPVGPQGLFRQSKVAPAYLGTLPHPLFLGPAIGNGIVWLLSLVSLEEWQPLESRLCGCSPWTPSCSDEGLALKGCLTLNERGKVCGSVLTGPPNTSPSLTFWYCAVRSYTTLVSPT